MSFVHKSPSNGAGSADVTGIYEPDTGSIQYIVADPSTKKAALVDVVLNFDPVHASISDNSARQVLSIVEQDGLDVEWILDTHPHADHFMASAWLKERLGAPTAIGEKTNDIAMLWQEIYNLPDAFDPTKSFDRLFADGDTFDIGTLPVRVMLSPGHTLGSITFVVGTDAALVHDTLMHVDSGTARADFPGGSAKILYNSIQSILKLPDETRLFVGHDYGTEDRHEPAWEASVAEHKLHNKLLGGGISEEEFVQMRKARDATLALPDRMLYALQFNLRGGQLPDPEIDGRSFFRIPANYF